MKIPTLPIFEIPRPPIVSWLVLLVHISHLALVLDAGVEAILEALAWERDVVGDGGVEGVVPEVGAVQLPGQVGVVLVVHLGDARQQGRLVAGRGGGGELQRGKTKNTTRRLQSRPQEKRRGRPVTAFAEVSVLCL